MKRSVIITLLAAAFSLAGCSQASPTDPSGGELDATSFTGVDSGSLDGLGNNPNATPITYVSTFAAFLGIEVHPNGNSGRSQERDLMLAFDVSGDLVGTATATLTNNNGVDKVGFATSHQNFILDVCWPARGLCGEFEGKSAGKITGAGIDFPISIAQGSGGFEGMTLRGELVECPDSNGDKGCFTGYIVE